MENKVMRRCFHQIEDSSVVHLNDDKKITFNYCPWCGIKLVTKDEEPEEKKSDEENK